MLDVVAPHQHELALPVEVVGVHDAEPGLAGPPVAGGTEPPAEQQAIEHEDDDEQDEDGGHHGGRRQQPVVLEKAGQRLHASVRLSTQAPLKC
ncbi:hypothetical protein [Lichenibacterium dinghuense]|uniref:hypothetical protein n=1 Tax=Lichenibacterium dinghuense TaxID=2895977 RepID=UPI001F182793|nr:hypothetical protein [Lichenibacterium sp. 6Y81]